MRSTILPQRMPVSNVFAQATALPFAEEDLAKVPFDGGDHAVALEQRCSGLPRATKVGYVNRVELFAGQAPSGQLGLSYTVGIEGGVPVAVYEGEWMPGPERFAGSVTQQHDFGCPSRGNKPGLSV